MGAGRGEGASDVIRRTALFMPTPVSREYWCIGSLGVSVMIGVKEGDSGQRSKPAGFID